MRELVEKYLKLSLEQIEIKLKHNDEVLNKIWNDDDGVDWEAYCRKCSHYWKDNQALLTAQSLLLPKEDILMLPFEPLDKECLVSIGEFYGFCKNKFILPSDGIGYYATETEVSDLQARTYAFAHGYIRKDFTHVCWYNR